MEVGHPSPNSGDCDVAVEERCWQQQRYFGSEMAAPVLNREPQTAPEPSAPPRVRMEAGRFGEARLNPF
jgi:hypothetical protein